MYVIRHIEHEKPEKYELFAILIKFLVIAINRLKEKKSYAIIALFIFSLFGVLLAFIILRSSLIVCFFFCLDSLGFPTK